MNYGFFFDYNNETIRLPVNPEKFSIGIEQEGTKKTVVGLGAIISVVLVLTSRVARKGRHISMDYRMPGARILDDYDAERKNMENLTK